MFDLSKWAMEGLASGYATGEFSFARITELSIGYLTKGVLTQAQVEEIAALCPPMPPESGANELPL